MGIVSIISREEARSHGARMAVVAAALVGSVVETQVAIRFAASRASSCTTTDE